MIQQQIAFASVVNPKGDIAPAWSAFIQNYVNRESWIEWAQTPDVRALRDDVLEYTDKPWYSKLNGLIP